MNSEKLNHIAANPAEISMEDARELESLTRSFPYFSLPYVLLSRFYAGTNDYRYEDTLHKTALRVSDRAWLYDFIHGRVAEPAAEPAAETTEAANATTLETPALEEEITTETAGFDVSTPATTTGNFDLPEILEVPDSGLEANEETLVEVESHVEIVVPTTQPEEIQSPLQLVKETVEEAPATDSPLTITEDISEVAATERIFEPDLSPEITETAFSALADEDAVFEEIPLFDVKEPLLVPAAMDTDAEVAEDDSLLDALLAQGSMLVPDVADETPAEETGEDADSKETHMPKLPAAGSVYNIEDYYPADAEGDDTAPSDFFSWLGKPAYKPGETQKPEEIKETKTALIEKFISNPASISRPKAEFFNAMDVAKKSDTFPDAIVTETLAGVYLQQGNYAGAIRIYEKLVLKFPQKSAYFAALIEKIKKEHHL